LADVVGKVGKKKKKERKSKLVEDDKTTSVEKLSKSDEEFLDLLQPVQNE